MDLRNLTDEELLTVAQGVADDTANPVVAEMVKRFDRALDDVRESDDEVERLNHLIEMMEPIEGD